MLGDGTWLEGHQVQHHDDIGIDTHIGISALSGKGTREAATMGEPSWKAVSASCEENSCLHLQPQAS